MVPNTITNNRENIMSRPHKTTAVRYSTATKKNALSLFSKGWTVAEIAKKHKTTAQTIHNWKKQFPEFVSATVVTSLSKNGVAKVRTIKTKPKKRSNTLTITLSAKQYEELIRQAKEDLRTIDSQVKFYLLNGIRNHHGIPF